MVKERQFSPLWHRRFNTIVIALVFIVIGGMLLGKNLGFVSPHVFGIVISWQMLLIVIGLASLVKRNLIAAFTLLIIGIFFLIPLITGVEKEWFGTYWPVIFIIIGIVMLFKRHNFKHHGEWVWGRNGENSKERGLSEDGFVRIDISFGGTNLIVLDPVFRGANIDISFGSVSLDLRKTMLEAPVTYIDVDCSFGSAELYMPSHWNVVVENDSTLSGCDDKRMAIKEIDYEHKLIIRGDLSFSGIVLKN